MQPVSVNVNPLSDILQIALGEEVNDEADEKAESNFFQVKHVSRFLGSVSFSWEHLIFIILERISGIPSFTRFLRMQLDALRTEKSKIYEVIQPT